MKTILKTLTVFATAAVGLAASSAANAAITISISQIGKDVVAAGSGSFDLSNVGTKFTFPNNNEGFADSSAAAIRVGSGPEEFYTDTLSGPTSFGPGSQTFATFSSGDLFGVRGSGGFGGIVFLPLNYVSNASLLGSSTFANTTLSALGLNVGTYVFSNTADRVTVNILAPTSAVPEPATWLTMMLGFGMLGATMRYRRRSTTAVFA